MRSKSYDREYMKKWKEANKDKIIANRKKDYISTHGRARNLYHTCKRRAKNKNLPFNLTVDWIENKLINGTCDLTRIPFDMGVKNAYTPSVDRIDSKRGYEIDNCRVILWGLNSAFNMWGEDTFLEIAKKLLRFSN